MKFESEKIRVLLDEVLPTSIECCGPSRDEVLSMLRHEHRRRRRVRTGVVLVGTLAVVAGALLWSHEPKGVAPLAQAPVQPAPIVIQTVNDEELFALLQGTPTALMKLPDGKSRLLLVEEASAR